MLNREDSRTAIPQLEKQIEKVADDKLNAEGAKEAVGLTPDLDYTITDTEYQELVNLLGGGRNKLIDWIYPVGRIIESTNADFDPNRLYIGTTWVKIEGYFLFGSGGSYSLGDTGGEATHTLTVDEIPRHNHTINGIANSCGGTGQVLIRNLDQGTPAFNASFTGGGKAHSNMPPYKVVNIWERTA